MERNLNQSGRSPQACEYHARHQNESEPDIGRTEPHKRRCGADLDNRGTGKQPSHATGVFRFVSREGPNVDPLKQRIVHHLNCPDQTNHEPGCRAVNGEQRVHGHNIGLIAKRYPREGFPCAGPSNPMTTTSVLPFSTIRLDGSLLSPASPTEELVIVDCDWVRLSGNIAAGDAVALS